MKQKIGFNTGEDDSSENEPEVGHAETAEEDPYVFWKETVLPMYLDFAIIYGSFAVIRDIISAFRKGGS